MAALLATLAPAQTPVPAKDRSESEELLSLSKKIDQQNIKIDLLSQQILRLQQQIEHPKTTPAEEGAPHAIAVGSPAALGNGNTHVVAKGETLTSIARMYKVSIADLQKLNHITDDRKLQIGQTLMIPGATGAATSPSPGASPNE